MLKTTLIALALLAAPAAEAATFQFTARVTNCVTPGDTDGCQLFDNARLSGPIVIDEAGLSAPLAGRSFNVARVLEGAAGYVDSGTDPFDAATVTIDVINGPFSALNWQAPVLESRLGLTFNRTGRLVDWFLENSDGPPDYLARPGTLTIYADGGGVWSGTARLEGPDVAPIPLPPAGLLLLGGLASLAGWRRRGSVRDLGAAPRR
jgi:hypothetical protein